MSSNLTNFNSRFRRGVAAVEAAICMPVLAVFIFGAVEVSGGIFQEYNAQSCVYELGKTALAPQKSCGDVKVLADQMLPQWGFSNYIIDIEVMARTFNAESVDAPTITAFRINEGQAAPAGLEEVPRGTMLKMTLKADRPTSVTDFYSATLGTQVTSECVFVKEF